MKKALIIGFGISGRSSAELLLSKGYSVLAVDKNKEELEKEGQVLPFLQKGLLLVSHVESLEGIDLVVFSPGVLLNHSLLEKARQKKIETIGEVELGLRELSNFCIGITGSNGKTTTCSLIEHLLNTYKIKAKAVGNIGKSITSYALEKDEEEVLIVELSSFQLESLQEKKLDMAFVLNITPNHLDRYASMEEYVLAKANIQKCLKKRASLFLSKQVEENWKSFFQDSFFSLEVAEKSFLSYTGLAAHAKENWETAYRVCKHFGLEDVDFLEGIKSFKKPKHRIEWVAEVDFVSYYNDSKSSNVESVIHAVKGIKGPIILLIGGVHKGASYAPWIEAFQGKVKYLVAFGEASSKMEKELAKDYCFAKVKDLKEAVECARRIAERDDTVLLSPGCSSYDQFKNFEHRGEEFKRMILSF